jgi:hypothetical protein
LTEKALTTITTGKLVTIENTPRPASGSHLPVGRTSCCGEGRGDFSGKAVEDKDALEELVEHEGSWHKRRAARSATIRATRLGVISRDGWTLIDDAG